MPERVAVVYAVKLEQCNRTEVKRIVLVVPLVCVRTCHVKMCFFCANAWQIKYGRAMTPLH